MPRLSDPRYLSSGGSRAPHLQRYLIAPAVRLVLQSYAAGRRAGDGAASSTAAIASECGGGSSTTKAAPPSGSLRPAAMEPLCSTTIFLTIARPRPVPSDLVVK